MLPSVDRHASRGSRCSLSRARSGGGVQEQERSLQRGAVPAAGKVKDVQLKRERERGVKVAMPINSQFLGTHVRKTCIFHVTPRKRFQPFTVTTARTRATMA